jgi:hypothetical protein
MTDKFHSRLVMTVLAIMLFCGAMAKSYAGGRPPISPPLQPNDVNELVERLKPSLSKFITDKDQVNQIEEKWQARKESLQGKDAFDAIELLFEDVKSVVTDVETQKKIRHEWDSNDDDEPDDPTSRLVKLGTSTSFALILLGFAIKRGRTL